MCRNTVVVSDLCVGRGRAQGAGATPLGWLQFARCTQRWSSPLQSAETGQRTGAEAQWRLADLTGAVLAGQLEHQAVFNLLPLHQNEEKASL